MPTTTPAARPTIPMGEDLHAIVVEVRKGDKCAIHLSDRCPSLGWRYSTALVTARYVRVTLNNRDMDMCGTCVAGRL
jgi:hypothetical protein